MTTAFPPPVLLCYDGSTGARHAIETAGALFPGRAAIVLHVWSPISTIAAAYAGAVSLPTYDDDILRRAAQTLAEEGARIATDAGLVARPEACETTHQGAPHTILDAAERHNAGLIVLGARGLSTFRSLLLVSMSHAVTQHARRPVLIVPPTAQPALAASAPEHEDRSTSARP
jgi:nucleotide-binding universal stress UspA family protein